MRLVSDPQAPPGVLVYEIQEITDDENLYRLLQIRSVLDEARKDNSKLVIDFTKITFYSSALFGILATIYRLSCESHGKTVACCMNRYGVEAMKVLRLEQLIPNFETREAAYGFFLEEDHAVS